MLVPRKIVYAQRHISQDDPMDQQVTQAATVQQFTTSECTELNELSALNEWQTDYLQRGRGLYSARFNLLISPQLRMTEQTCSREMLVTSAPPPGHLALVMPLNPGHGGTLQGVSLGQYDIALIGPGCEAVYRSPINVRLLVVTVPISLIRRMLATESVEDIDQLVGRTWIFGRRDAPPNVFNNVFHAG